MAGSEGVPRVGAAGPYQADTRVPNPVKMFEAANNFVTKTSLARDALRGASIGPDLVGQMRAHANYGPGFQMRIPIEGRARTPAIERAEARLNAGWREMVQGLMVRTPQNAADYDSWLGTTFRLGD